MKAVARLVALYYSASTSARACTVVGAVLIVVGCVFNAWFNKVEQNPLFHYQSALILDEIPRWLLPVLVISPLAGFVVLIFGSALLPKIVGPFSLSRRLRLLPGGHAKLVASALVMNVLIANVMTVAVAATSLFLERGPATVLQPAQIAELAATVFFLALTFCTVVHVGLWLIGRFSSPLGALSGVLLLVVVLALVMRAIALVGENAADLMRALSFVSVALWVVLALAITRAPALHAAALGVAARLRRGSLPFVAGARYSSGHELDLALGTARPWFFAAGLTVPFGAALWFFDDPVVWSFYFALFAAILGGLAGFAAARTRRLWLRTELDRAALYAQVERAYLRHSAYGLAALAACHVALGLYTGLPAVKMAWGLLTLALGTFACLYLGLTMTRGIGWRTAVTTIATMALLMFTASRAAAPDANVATVAVLELALLALALVFRSVAVKRWSELDWSHCRADVEAHASA